VLGMRAQFVIPVLASILILGTLGLTEDAFAQTTISSCGILNIAGETFILNQNISTSGTCFTIEADDITLDGNGFTITGDGTGVGVLTIVSFDRGLRGVFGGRPGGNSTTGNTISGNSAGIGFNGGVNNSIIGNTVSGNASNEGIFLNGGENNSVIGNTVTDNGFTGIAINSSDGNSITGNTVSGSTNTGIAIVSSNNNDVSNNDLSNNVGTGIRLNTSSNNNISGNSISNSNNDGISLFLSNSNSISDNTVSGSGNGIRLFLPSDNNQIFNNNFIDNTTQASDSGSGNVFNLSAPTGGNYWNNFDEPVEGCNDANSDGFCDDPFVFFGGQDNLPWTTQNGWVVSRPIGGEMIPIEITAVLLAGVQTNLAWMIPVVAAGIVIGVFVIKRRK